ncbi:unnamed protein product [Trichobilharzia szidati]|nr:unnamed protein product [Trichobilharzia szidati]
MYRRNKQTFSAVTEYLSKATSPITVVELSAEDVRETKALVNNNLSTNKRKNEVAEIGFYLPNSLVSVQHLCRILFQILSPAGFFDFTVVPDY